MASISAQLGIDPERKNYDSLSDYVNALNEQEEFWYSAMSGGGIMGWSTHYSVFTYIYGDTSKEGYKKVSHSAVGGMKEETYYDENGNDITAKLYNEKGNLIYRKDSKIKNYWLVIAAGVILVAGIIIFVVRKRRK